MHLVPSSYYLFKSDQPLSLLDKARFNHTQAIISCKLVLEYILESLCKILSVKESTILFAKNEEEE